MMPRRISALWTLLAGLTAAWAGVEPRGTDVPGGIAIVPLAPASEVRPQVWLEGHRVMVLRRAAQWEAIVGIPLDARPGALQLEVTIGARRSTRTLTVRPKHYAVQRITLRDTRKVNPAPDDLRRIEQEAEVIDAAKALWTDSPSVALNLQLPVHGRISSPFGLRRFFNGKPRKPHAGIDIAVPRGTRVEAAGAGRVIATGSFFFNGKTVFVDHGQGLVTMYCHLERIDVAAGEALKRGQPIGLSGMTGRATGPHLHWSVILNDTLVDPMVFVGGDLQRSGDDNGPRTDSRQ